jgi:hypothetical protein
MIFILHPSNLRPSWVLYSTRAAARSYVVAAISDSLCISALQVSTKPGQGQTPRKAIRAIVRFLTPVWRIAQPNCRSPRLPYATVRTPVSTPQWRNTVLLRAEVEHQEHASQTCLRSRLR